jgi:WD40 repeat protein
MSRGLVALHYFDYKGENSKKKKGPLSTISDVLASRHDCAEAISDVKFSPSSDRLAVGSHDNFIDVYDILLTVPRTSSESPAARIHPHKRIRGHSSYITHLDWSLDGRLVQSTCGAYEILYWDAESGKQFAAPNPSDLKWKTYTCILGFGVMGIWPPFADGTDINSLHVSRDKSLVVTGDDSGLVNVFNYPCVVKNAPRQSFTGHSSHVTNVRFAYDDSMIVSVGGHDNCAICWVVTKKKLRNPLPPDSGWV